MHVAARRVVLDRLGLEGVNAYCYRHGRRLAAGPPPDGRHRPEAVRRRSVVVREDGARVQSQLVVVAPDGLTTPEIERSLLEFTARHAGAPFPWSDRVGRCGFAFEVRGPRARRWAEELLVLLDAALALRPD